MTGAPTSPATSQRWMVLLAFAAVTACTQLLWLSYAAIDTQAAHDLKVDVSSIGDLALVMPLAYIVFSLPFGKWLDKSFKSALACGGVLTAVGAVVRATAPGSFTIQVAGQAVIAVGQPLVLNALTGISRRYFPERERATAIAVGTVALFTGILAAVLLGNPLYSSGGLGRVLSWQAVAAVASVAMLLACLRVPQLYVSDPGLPGDERTVLKDRFIWLLAALVFVGMGTYNAIATWLQPILDRVGEGYAAGNLIALMTGAGIVGAATLSPMVAARNRRKAFLLASLSVSVLTFTALAARHEILWYAIWLTADGVLLMTGLPVILDWSEEHAGPRHQAMATGLLLMAGNVGGLVIPGVMQLFLNSSSLPLLLLALVALLGLPPALRLPSRL